MDSRKKLPANERKKQIREVAKDIFIEKGFDNTTMESIVEAVGMSKGGVYRHYKSTTEMLHDLMIDGNFYRKSLIDEYLEKHKSSDKYEKMSEILVNKALADKDLMKLYAIFLQAKNHNNELEKLYQLLKEETKSQFKSIAREIGIPEEVFSDDFIVNYVNGLVLSCEILQCRNSFNIHREYFKNTIKNFIREIEKNN